MQGYINVVRAYPQKTFPISAALAFPASTTLKRMLSGWMDFCANVQAKKKENSINIEIIWLDYWKGKENSIHA